MDEIAENMHFAIFILYREYAARLFSAASEHHTHDVQAEQQDMVALRKIIVKMMGCSIQGAETKNGICAMCNKNEILCYRNAHEI